MFRPDSPGHPVAAWVWEVECALKVVRRADIRAKPRDWLEIRHVPRYGLRALNWGEEMSQLIPAWIDDRLVACDKLEVHLKGLRHKAVSVFVVAGDQLLIQQRALVKYHTPGLWANTCCTHPEWGEAALDCAHRRLQQELGIAGLELVHKGQLEYRANVGGNMIEDEVVEVFLAETTPDLPITPNPDEVMDYRWISLADLQQKIEENQEMFTPWLRIYMAEHREQILG